MFRIRNFGLERTIERSNPIELGDYTCGRSRDSGEQSSGRAVRYLLLNNEEIRHVIDTITSKVVLILGRFMPERKAILDAIRR